MKIYASIFFMLRWVLLLLFTYMYSLQSHELMGGRYPRIISVLGDYASVDCYIDPDEVHDSERPTKLRLPQPDINIKSGMTIKESVCDVVLGGGEYIVNDVKFTVSQTVEPIMEKGLTRFNEKLTMFSENITEKTKDDSCITRQHHQLRESFVG